MIYAIQFKMKKSYQIVKEDDKTQIALFEADSQEEYAKDKIV